MADETTGAAPATTAASKKDAAAADKIAALIRNGLNDSALSRDAVAWDALETRLPQIVAAILSEV